MSGKIGAEGAQELSVELQGAPQFVGDLRQTALKFLDLFPGQGIAAVLPEAQGEAGKDEQRTRGKTQRDQSEGRGRRVGVGVLIGVKGGETGV